VIAEDKNAYAFAFRLYVTGNSARSTKAVTNAVRLFNEKIGGQYTLDIVDISLYPERAVTDQIVAVPTLLRVKPHPKRRIVGDLSDAKKVIAVFNLA
jgi:circadian clock protein KaiB